MPPRNLAAAYRIIDGRNFRLDGIDPSGTGGCDLDKKEAKALLRESIGRLSELQDTLYAQDRWAVLVIIQAMDAAGKDSAIKHVMSGVNPTGCDVHSFKAPSEEDLDHDFLWRAMRRLPERGRIGIFNRSYYEDVLVVRVHPEWLERQKIPAPLKTPRIWEERFEDINAVERYLARNGIVIVKFFLHVSKEEQRKRFLKRLDNPEKHWKFSAADVEDRRYWDDYMRAYDETIRRTATAHAPWYVVPADHKWFTRLVLVSALIDTLEGLDLAYPSVGDETRAKLGTARETLERE